MTQSLIIELKLMDHKDLALDKLKELVACIERGEYLDATRHELLPNKNYPNFAYYKVTETDRY